MSERHRGLDYLRGFVVLHVVAGHATGAYVDFGRLLDNTPSIQDAHKSVVLLFFALFSDAYFMALLFFLSGLFVWPSLARRGAWGFFRARILRLGVPLVVGVPLLMPPTFYAWVLSAGGKIGLFSYWAGFFAQPVWFLGPSWFLLVLLIFDMTAAVLYRLAPVAGNPLARWTSGAARHPLLFALAVVACATAVFEPLLLTFGPVWAGVAHVYLPASRLLFYAVFFFAGVIVGARGVGSSLVAPDGVLARRWPRWVWAAVAGQLLYLGTIFLVIPGLVQSAPLLASLVYSLVLAFVCTTCVLAFVAAFQRFARPSAIFEAIAANSFGIYVVHFVFVYWAQYFLLGWDLPGIVKGVAVFVIALSLSWLCTALLRRLPFPFVLVVGGASGSEIVRPAAPRYVSGLHPTDQARRANSP